MTKNLNQCGALQLPDSKSWNLSETINILAIKSNLRQKETISLVKKGSLKFFGRYQIRRSVHFQNSLKTKSFAKSNLKRKQEEEDVWRRVAHRVQVFLASTGLLIAGLVQRAASTGIQSQFNEKQSRARLPRNITGSDLTPRPVKLSGKFEAKISQ